MKNTVEDRNDLLAENRYAGYAVYDYAGEKIGKVDEFFVDDDRTEYVGVKIDPLGLSSTLIPIDITRVSEQRRLVEVAASKEGVKATLALDESSETTPDFKQQVRSFLGVKNDGVLEVPPDGWMVPFLLVRLQEGDYHGRELAQKVTYPGYEASRPRTVYQVLQQMEKEGMILSRGDGLELELSRRRYSITKLGDDYLEYLANALAQYGEEIDLFFRFFNKQLAREPQLEHYELQSERETRKDAQARY